MSTATQYNPNRNLNAMLLAEGLSKTVYALVTPETEGLRAHIQQGDYLDQFREAWTAKQDALHEDFFTKWHEWSSPVVALDRANFPFYYPTAGASEPLRQIIFNFAAKGGKAVHVFEGEYEGYKAMAEAAGLHFVEWPRAGWRDASPCGSQSGWNGFRHKGTDDLFFISQPSAIDGNVWQEFNEFVASMPRDSVVADVTYVGAIPETALKGTKINLNAPSIRNVVFSLSKPFGAYYDRIGGCFAREEDLGLFGNRWFKNLTSIRYGMLLMENLPVFALPTRYSALQREAIEAASRAVSKFLKPSDVYILGHDIYDTTEVIRGELVEYLQRGRKTVRICLTPFMAEKLGTGRIQR